MRRLARLFKVSTVVILRRIFDMGGMDKTRFWDVHNNQVRAWHLSESADRSIYRVMIRRANRRFAKKLVSSVMEGKTTHIPWGCCASNK